MAINSEQINQLLIAALSYSSTDLILRAGQPVRYVRFNEIKALPESTLSAQDIEDYFASMATPKMLESYAQTLDVDLAHLLPNNVRLRVHVARSMGKITIDMRAFPDNIPTMASLGLPNQVIAPHLLTKRGIILVTGRTGNGKSTSLASMINYMGQASQRHIVTIEDPIEYIYESGGNSIYTQREVGLDTLGFAHCVEDVMRQRPDVILIGEVADPETARALLSAAESGHLVLGTVHAESAAQTINRFIDFFPADMAGPTAKALAEALVMVLSQQLITNPDNTRYHLAYELMIATQSIRNLIREQKLHQINSAIQTGKSLGMVLMDDTLTELVAQGAITADQALNHATNPKTLAATLNVAPTAKQPAGEEPNAFF